MRYQGSVQEYDVIINRNVMVPMRDGVHLAADVYFPANDGKKINKQFPVVLERTPYDKSTMVNRLHGGSFARRGYVVVKQDVRGRFESEGIWYAFAREAEDGYDTVEWLAKQPWSNGKIGTEGSSYAGSDQSALATLNPPHLSTMIVSVGAANYYHASMRQNGVLEQRFLVYVYRMATTSKEALADPGLKAALEKAFTEDMPDKINKLPLREGTTVLSRLPSYEKWALDIQNHADYDDYWKGHRGYAISEYYDEHADVPTLYFGGWYDSYARATCENFIQLSKRKSSDQFLLMGPWDHGGWQKTFSGEIDFGVDSVVDYEDLRLSWFDRYLKELNSEVENWKPVKFFTMGTGDQRPNYHGMMDQGGYWADALDWPLPGTQFTQFYLHGDGQLSPEKPGINVDKPFSTYTFDPKNPVPTIGGGISAADSIIPPGGFDQRCRPEVHGCADSLPLNMRSDVLSFQTPGLKDDVEVTGPIEMHLWVASSALDTDFTAKLIDVHPSSVDYPEGLAINISDSVMRARYRNGYEKPELLKPEEPFELVFQLYPSSNIFRAGHRIRLDISSSNWPRFDVNPNTGGELGVDRQYVIANQTVYHEVEYPSHIVLPIQDK